MTNTRPLILASSSPRRQFLMHEAGFAFEVLKPDVDESFPSNIPVTEVARYLAEKKAQVFSAQIREHTVLTADTVVILGDRILNKPADRAEAIDMLSALSGRSHIVMTGVCILSEKEFDLFDETTEVIFNKLTLEEITYYVDNYQPFDKAGAYGAQDCLSPDMNPCSAEEISFLTSIGRLDLIAESFTKKTKGEGINAIKAINGSYFNVMGLPIHRVYERLQRQR